MLSPAAPSPDSVRAERLRFVRRIYSLRTLGLGLGFFCVAAVLYENGASAVTWALLIGNGFLWPHAAYALARRSVDPQATEFRNLVVDSTLGGIWVAVMQFNLLPSALLLTMLTVDKISVDGLRLLARTLPLQIGACLITWALLGFGFRPESSMRVVLACLPFLIAYPLAISTVTRALASKVLRQNRRLEELNRTDALTGLPNRQHWQNEGSRELGRRDRNGRPAALLMIDIDGFKAINDRHGHLLGDEVLRRVADVLKQSVRSIDTPGRYAGDEFGVVLVETDLAGAVEVAERIRRQVEHLRFEAARDLRCTVSIGVAEAVHRSDQVDAWVAQADAALYRAKTAGRNCVIALEPEAGKRQSHSIP